MLKNTAWTHGGQTTGHCFHQKLIPEGQNSAIPERRERNLIIAETGRVGLPLGCLGWLLLIVWGCCLMGTHWATLELGEISSPGSQHEGLGTWGFSPPHWVGVTGCELLIQAFHMPSPLKMWMIFKRFLFQSHLRRMCGLLGCALSWWSS